MSPRAKKRRASFSDSGEDEVPAVVPKAKKSKAAAARAPDGKDDEGNPFWEVNLSRRPQKATREPF